ncbi:MAG: hypothetical protein ACYSX0_12360 [Planctomycetota bacterium]|jgi:hypothetical protein
MSDIALSRFASRATPPLLCLILAMLLYRGFLHSPEWEYRIGRFGDEKHYVASALAEEMNLLGAQGWEIVAFETLSWDDDRAAVGARVVLRRAR